MILSVNISSNTIIIVIIAINADIRINEANFSLLVDFFLPIIYHSRAAI